MAKDKFELDYEDLSQVSGGDVVAETEERPYVTKGNGTNMNSGLSGETGPKYIPPVLVGEQQN